MVRVLKVVDGAMHWSQLRPVSRNDPMVRVLKVFSLDTTVGTTGRFKERPDGEGTESQTLHPRAPHSRLVSRNDPMVRVLKEVLLATRGSSHGGVSRNDPMVRVLKAYLQLTATHDAVPSFKERPDGEGTESGCEACLDSFRISFKERPDGEGTERRCYLKPPTSKAKFQGTTRW